MPVGRSDETAKHRCHLPDIACDGNRDEIEAADTAIGRIGRDPACAGHQDLHGSTPRLPIPRCSGPVGRVSWTRFSARSRDCAASMKGGRNPGGSPSDGPRSGSAVGCPHCRGTGRKRIPGRQPGLKAHDGRGTTTEIDQRGRCTNTAVISVSYLIRQPGQVQYSIQNWNDDDPGCQFQLSAGHQLADRNRPRHHGR